MVENDHWHLDVTFCEDGDLTLEKKASYNLNIMRKLLLNVLKLVEVGSKGLRMNKEAVCDRNKSRKTSGEDNRIINF